MMQSAQYRPANKAMMRLQGRRKIFRWIWYTGPQWTVTAPGIRVTYPLLIELRQNTESAEFQAAQSHAAISYELDFRMVDDPSLIVLLNTPPSERTPEDLQRLNRWFFGTLRTWQNGFYLHSKGVLDDDLWSSQEAFISDLLGKNEDIRHYYEINRDYFSDSFVSFLDSPP